MSQFKLKCFTRLYSNNNNKTLIKLKIFLKKLLLLN